VGQVVVRQRGGRRALLALIVFGGAAFVQCGFRQDEVECEEAVRYLSECCEGFAPIRIRCTYQGGCDTDTVPDVPVSQSQCILATSCDEIRRNRVCERLLQEEADGGLGRRADNTDPNGILDFEQTKQAEDICP
jgi:hypothetical protein